MEKIKGYLQNKIIELGKEKGYVTSDIVAIFYQSSKVRLEMEKLVALGYFEKGENKGTYIYWKYKGQENGN